MFAMKTNFFLDLLVDTLQDVIGVLAQTSVFGIARSSLGTEAIVAAASIHATQLTVRTI